MGKIILEGHNYFSASITKKDIYSLDKKDRHHCRILVDVKSEICRPQIMFISYDSKTSYWLQDELLIAFNKASDYIKLLIETDGFIKTFEENLFHLETKELQADELKVDFQIEIPDNKKILVKINDDLLRIKEAQSNFDECKNKLSKVINWGPDVLNAHRYNINRVVDYLYNVINAGVVTDSNNESIRKIRFAFDELARRKSNHTVSMTHTEIFSLQFPNYFKSSLPQIDIKQVLNEIC